MPACIVRGGPIGTHILSNSCELLVLPHEDLLGLTLSASGTPMLLYWIARPYNVYV